MRSKSLLVAFNLLLMLSIGPSHALAQGVFGRNDAYDFRGVHALSFGGINPNTFHASIGSNGDFRTFKLLVKTGEVLRDDWFVNRVKVDIDNNGTWDIDVSSGQQVLTHTFPEPSGTSDTYTAKIEVVVSSTLGGQTPPETRTKYHDLTILPTPRVFVNAEEDVFVQLRDQDCTDRVPILLVEGFDPLNQTFPEAHYRTAEALIEQLYDTGHEVFILNFHDAGMDIAENADVVLRAIEKVHSLCPNNSIALVGLSMGGVVSRFALAKREGQGGTHNVGLFVSYDSPQSGANLSPGLQDWIADQNPSNDVIESLQASLASVAARQMLLYDTYDPDHELRFAFEDVIDTLNTTGYPVQSYNVAVSNGNFEATEGYGSVGREMATLALIVNGNETTVHAVSATEFDCAVGSRMTDLAMVRYGDVFALPFLLNIDYKFEVEFNPVFIPTWSSLDLPDNFELDEFGNLDDWDPTPFDDYVVQTTAAMHNAVTSATQTKIGQWLNKPAVITVNYSFPDGVTASPDTFHTTVVKGRTVTIPSKTGVVSGQTRGYIFDHWEDGNPTNPRRLYASHDVTRTVTMKRQPAPGVSINGPSHLNCTQVGTWNSAPTGGDGAFARNWEWRWQGETTWSSGGTQAAMQSTMSGAAPLEMKVTVTSNGEQATSSVFTCNYDGCGGGGGGGEECPGCEEMPDFANRTVGMATISPKPVRGTVSISFNLASDEDLRVSVYDIGGREVEQLSAIRGRGPHSVRWDASRYPMGLYFVRATVGGMAVTQKVLVVGQ